MPTLILDAHPNPDSLGAALVRAYREGDPGAELITIRDLNFNPSLERGLTAPQELEPDLVDARRAIETATHLVIVTPTWWSGTPARFKGFLDRVFTPGWAYRYDPVPTWATRLGLPAGTPVGLLKGRTGRILITSDTPHWLLRLNGDHAATVLRKHVLRFCGITPVRVKHFGSVRWSTPEQRASWLGQATELGQLDADTSPRPRQLI